MSRLSDALLRDALNQRKQNMRSHLARVLDFGDVRPRPSLGTVKFQAPKLICQRTFDKSQTLYRTAYFRLPIKSGIETR
jgi:hypothetical protein